MTATERRGQAWAPTYRSMQVDEPGAALHPVEKEIPAPRAGDVRVTVEDVTLGQRVAVGWFGGNCGGSVGFC